MQPTPFLLGPGKTLAIEIYRCPNCSVGFGQERTVAGPKYCPACGAIFDAVVESTVPDLLRVVAAICADNSGPKEIFCTLEPGHPGDHKNMLSNGGGIGWRQKGGA